MVVSARQYQILQILNEQTVSLSGRSIADSMNISIRTLQNEIAAINRMTGEKLIHSDRKGYSVDRQLLKTVSCEQEETESKDTALDEILRILLLEDMSVNIEDLADRLYISSSTLYRRLKSLEVLLSSYRLNLNRRKNCLSIDGEESCKRKLIYDRIVSETNANFKSLEEISGYFSDLNFIRIQEVVTESCRKYQYYLDPNHASNVYINLMIVLSRIYRHFQRDYAPGNTDCNSVEYKIAEDICRQMSDHWHIQFSEQDIAYIDQLLTGQVRADSPDSREEDDFSDFLLKKIIMDTFSYYELSFHGENFLPTFTAHIRALVKRAKNKQYVGDLVSENIRELSPFVYDVAVRLSHNLEKEFQIVIPEEEINLLSIYIGLSVEPSPAGNVVRVVLICDEYHHMADRIVQQLEDFLGAKIQIAEVLTQPPFASSEQNIDLIVRTVPIHVLGTKSVLITPFFNDKDRRNVEDAVNQILQEHQDRKQRNLLLTYFDQKLFFRNQGIRTRDDAIRFLSRKLIDSGLCTDEFYDSVLHREEMASTCFFNSFAVPHSLDMNAKITQIAILIEEDGLLWENAPISCVFMVAVNRNDSKEFVKIYGSIIETVCRKDCLEQLKMAEDFDTFMHVFEQK